MNTQVYKFATREVPEVIEEALANAGFLFRLYSGSIQALSGSMQALCRLYYRAPDVMKE
jgi:hypothetical protein